MNKTEIVRGYKVFNPDWTCRDKQYTCPGKFEEDVNISICNQGMHFCRKAADCFNYYGFNPDNKVAEVAAYGTVVEEDNKCCTDKLEIIREIPWQELLEIVNTGYRKSGHNNSGDYNSGNYNSGDYKSGDWNETDFSNGCFNTAESKIFMFNRLSEWTFRDYINSKARYLLGMMPKRMVFVKFKNMTDEEKTNHPEAETTGGFLKENTEMSEDRQKWWDDLSEDDKKIIQEMPNFDAAIFEEILGIKI